MNNRQDNLPTALSCPAWPRLSSRVETELIEGNGLKASPLAADSPDLVDGERWSQPGSNRRPLACHASALPAELWPREFPKSSGEIEVVTPSNSRVLVVARGGKTKTDLEVPLQERHRHEEASIELE